MSPRSSPHRHHCADGRDPSTQTSLSTAPIATGGPLSALSVWTARIQPRSLALIGDCRASPRSSW